MAQLLIDGSRTKDEDIRTQNVMACNAVANALRTSLGPTGLDKMLVDQIGDVTISNDGATIVKKLDVEHPAAKLLVQLADLQDQEVGDGTTSVVILAAELLKRGNELVKRKIHPTSIISGYKIAMKEAARYLKQNLSFETDKLGKGAIMSAAKTSMSSKIITTNADHFSDICVRALERVKRSSPTGKNKYPVSAINVLKAPGKSARDSFLIEGFGLNCTVASEVMPKFVKNAKIAFVDFNVTKWKMPTGVKLRVNDPKELQKMRNKEVELLKEKLKLIIDAGANVILTTKALDDVAAKILAEHKVMGVRRCKKSDLKKIARGTGGTLLLDLIDEEAEESFSASNLGSADSVEQMQIGDNEMIVIKGGKSQSSSIVLRGANTFMLEEMERSVHDTLCAVQRVLESRRVVAGGGATECALAMYLETFARSLGSREQLSIVEFAHALLAIPKQLALNSALDASDLVAKLCTLHKAAQDKNSTKEQKEYSKFGLDLDSGKARDNVAAGVLEPALSKFKSLRFATEAAITILRIDDLIKLNPKQQPQQDPNHPHM